jgi:tetratricopeptide (TPR) repeat protein
MILSALTIAIAALVLSRAEIWRSHPGSYEYIRKGESLLEKGAAREALGYFEKAYVSSPDNREIRTDLAYAYSRYGALLADKDDYDGAIELLAKAADVEPGTATMQNLAIMYARRGIWRARNGYPASSRKDLEAAREAASCSEPASRNLGVALYNEAALEFKSNRYDLAVIFLKESALAYESDYAFESTGDIYYRLREYGKARFYFDKAIEVNPQNSSARAKSQKAAKEEELSRREESRELPHFELKSSAGMPMDEEALKRVLERCYLEVGADFGYFPDSKTVIILYSHEDFRSIFHMPREVRAFYDGNIRIPLPEEDLPDKIFSDYLYHEYTHAVISAKTDNNCPVWFNEGLAMWEEYKDKNDIILDLIVSLIDKKELSLAALEKAFEAKEKDPRMYYLLTYSIVKYIVDNWGLEGVRSLLFRIKRGQHVINAIDDEFLLSEKEFERRWQDYVIEKFLRK